MMCKLKLSMEVHKKKSNLWISYGSPKRREVLRWFTREKRSIDHKWVTRENTS